MSRSEDVEVRHQPMTRIPTPLCCLGHRHGLASRHALNVEPGEDHPVNTKVVVSRPTWPRRLPAGGDDDPPVSNAPRHIDAQRTSAPGQREANACADIHVKI